MGSLPPELLLLAGIILLAHTAETVLGFGATLIALALGVHLFPLDELLLILVVLGLVQSTWLILRGYRHIDWPCLLRRIIPFAAFGMAGGIALRGAAPEYTLKLILGTFVMAIAAWELRRHFRKATPAAPFSGSRAAAILSAGGVFHGLFASGGPLVVYYASRRLTTPVVFRSTLAVLWFALNAVLFMQLTWAGSWQTSPLPLLGFLLVAAVLGIAVGESLRINKDHFRILTYGLLLMSGASLIW